MARYTKDPVQLQQKLIHVQSELKKEQERIDQFKRTYNYQYIEQLKEDNHLLEIDKEELERHLYDLEKKLEKYKRQMDVANLKVKMYQDAWEKIDQEYQQLKEDYQELKENHQDLQGRLFKLNSEQQQNEVILIEKNQNIEKLENKHTSQNQHIEELVRTQFFQNKKIEQLELKSQALSNEAHHYRQQTKSTQNAYGQLERVFHQFLISHLINQLKGISQQMIYNQKNDSSKTQLILALEERLAEISDEIIELESQSEK
ncbi:hypothetical protein ACTWQB_06040 [Piscibacillus sp. B03]|uniref:hypothetical protein n=1 Tax=Piscibacillus sp. B03 TaxID=3457430 RepID=UPI003FCD075E